MRQLLVILLLTLSMSGRAVTYYIRAGASGAGSGTSYENAWPGFGKVVWGPAGVHEGDTLYVCGTHEYGRDFAYLKNTVGAGGEDGAPITIRGDYPGNPGAIVGARRIPVAAFTLGANGVYSAPFGFSAAYAWQGDPTQTPKLLRGVSSVAEVAAREGCFWRDPVAKVFYVKPYGGAMSDIYSNWVGALYLNGKSNVTIKNLRLFGGAGNDGVVRLTKGHGDARNITIDGCEIAFGYYAGIYAGGGNTANIAVRNTRLHHVMTGTYTLGIVAADQPHLSHDGWMFDGVEVYANEEVDLIFDNRDRHALGGQNIRNLLIQNCYVHDWPGEGVIDYVTAAGKMDNVTIRYNRFHNLNDATNSNWHYGVAKHGSSSAQYEENTKNWHIYNNIFTELGGDKTINLGVGAAIRIKGGAALDGNQTLVANNVFYHCNYGLFISATTLGNVGATVKNNISLSPLSGGAHVWVYNFGGASTLDIDNNLYYPDGLWTWKSAGQLDFAAWKTQASADAHSVLADPRFDNASATLSQPNDFKPRPISPAIDAGADVGLANDYFGNPIPQGTHPDIGIYERLTPKIILIDADGITTFTVSLKGK